MRTTGEIGLFKIVSETGSAAGVRRIEAVTGPRAYEQVKGRERLLSQLSRTLKVPEGNLAQRVEALVEEKRDLQEQLQATTTEAAAGQVNRLIDAGVDVDGARVVVGTIETADSQSLRAFGDKLREGLGSGVGVIAAKMGERHSLLAVVTDDLVGRGVRADEVVREVAKLAGGQGGGRPHMAQASTSTLEHAQAALARVPEIVRPMLSRI